MMSRSRVTGLIVTVGALAALPLVAAAPASARHHHHHQAKGSDSKPSSAAYPKSPGDTPAAGNGGKPIEPKSSGDAKPAPAAKAGTETAPKSTGTPATAYPGAPTNQPAAGAKP